MPLAEWARRLPERWYRPGLALPLWPLLPLSWLFGAIGAWRRWAYRRHLLPSYRLPVPVIVVGNLTVGGSGKTPLVLWLVGGLLGVLGAASWARGDVPVYVQAPHAAGGQYKSAWYAPDGLDGDEYVWDAFTLPTSTAVTQVQWRGAYTNYLSGAGLAPVYNFTVAFYGSIGGGSQPDIVA
ncbi:MAG TPA: tetraacyldisaccharide 4'-kinase, partial [Accumulibacter sp.]|nr:tetraacyldisaccharide 4'-kinase [Accumulibacter sp.]